MSPWTICVSFGFRAIALSALLSPVCLEKYLGYTQAKDAYGKTLRKLKQTVAWDGGWRGKREMKLDILYAPVDFYNRVGREVDTPRVVCVPQLQGSLTRLHYQANFSRYTCRVIYIHPHSGVWVSTKSIPASLLPD